MAGFVVFAVENLRSSTTELPFLNSPSNPLKQSPPPATTSFLLGASRESMDLREKLVPEKVNYVSTNNDFNYIR